MSMFELALKARIPIIGVQSDDVLNFKKVLQLIAGRSALSFPQHTVGDQHVYYSYELKEVTAANYAKLCDAGASLVILNPDKAHPLLFDGGVLPTPSILLQEYLKHFVPEDKIAATIQALQGLSLKTAQEVVQLASAKFQCCTPQGIRNIRMMLGGATPGLETLETDYDFYIMPKQIQEWLDLNSNYFLNLNVPQKLVPRGLLLVGDPGVGKSMASQAIARHFSIPLFRFDISTSLNRYLGASESRILTNLGLISQNAPCILLLDEVEKLFGASTNEEGTLPRILSQILWWLQHHKDRVLTIMTSNNIDSLPPELYRPGRIDKVIKIDRLILGEAKLFAHHVYQSITGKQPKPRRLKYIRDLMDKTVVQPIAHADVVELVSTLIKSKNWLDCEEDGN